MTDSLPIGSDSLPTGSWDGLPPHPERNGWHWLVPAINPALPPGAYRWHAPPRADVVGQWDAGYPQDVVRRGYAYAGPCVMPDEAARMRAALAEANEAAEANAAWGGRMKQERDALQDAWLRVIQVENSCAVTGRPCEAKRCGCVAEMRMLMQEASDAG